MSLLCVLQEKSPSPKSELTESAGQTVASPSETNSTGKLLPGYLCVCICVGGGWGGGGRVPLSCQVTRRVYSVSTKSKF